MLIAERFKEYLYISTSRPNEYIIFERVEAKLDENR